MRKETRSRSTRERLPDPRYPAGGFRRWRLLLAYDGSAFSGWQFQGNGRSVQEHLERALQRICQSDQRLPVHAAGRTDAGVHALAQVVHFDAPATLSLDGAAWTRALNTGIPPQMRVLDAAEAEHGFHARYSAVGKHYRYRLCCGPILPPLEFARAGHWRHPLDGEFMRQAASRLVGEHDFSGFAAYRNDGTDQTPESGRNLRCVTRADVAEVEGGFEFDFEGSGFLYKMVRMMVGALIHAGAGRLAPDEIGDILACRLDSTGRLRKSPLCASAGGLYLAEVRYGCGQSNPPNHKHLNLPQAKPLPGGF